MGLDHIVAAGAGQAAVQLAAVLRQGGYDGRITLVGDEPGLPCHRPPLSKAYLAGDAEAASVLLRPEAFYATQRIDLVSDRVGAIERRERQLRLASGAALGYDHLVFATGASNRTLPGVEPAATLGLRTLADADSLRELLRRGGEALVIGAGFIGLEFAAVAAAQGVRVTILEMAQRPLTRAVSAVMADHIASVHLGWGTRLLAGVSTQGESVAADFVLTAIGVRPNTALAEACRLPVANGIVVDAELRTADPSISAIGDCAAFPTPFAPHPVRLESVQNAVDQGRCVAERLLGRPAAYTRVPWFWSDQGKLKLQIVGLAAPDDECVVRGDPEGGSFSVFRFRAGVLTAIESLNRPADHMAGRRLLAGTPTLTPDEAADPSFDLRGRPG